MISYKVDDATLATSNDQILQMDKVLASIAENLQALQELIALQESALSSPSIDDFRRHLQKDVNQAISLTKQIADKSYKFATVSTQAGKYLSSIEDHFVSALNENNE